ncbi:acyltransferase family protein [Shewanella surugensis]|uniref:Acyltransferase n=1 Tax=Shewanella surugensis TaxID=212020 RepID=A0ABT0LB33_9GAMM|nr:acyltransferase family protein [Shewanella surugensis]MCL1124913.1 acyltransferase [Shewanella surugensis]
MHYRPEIDGLRAVAVIPVILFHAGFHIFSGGFVGVDVFFVISGYLITSIIIAELDEDRFSLITFYERRARRILPALFFVILICIPFAWMWFMPLDLQDFAQSIVAVSTFSSNILFWLESDYFDTAAELKPLLHTWSLAVEEQYYILFPLFLMWTWHLGIRWILGLLAIVFIASLAAAQWGAYNAPNAAFYLLPTRGWELLMGVFATFFFHRYKTINFNNKIKNTFSLIGVFLIIYAIFAFDETVPFPSLYTLFPTIGTLLIIVFGQKGTVVHSFLSQKVLVGIGLISYSAYLWHQPLFAFAKYRSFTEPSVSLMMGLCVISLMLAYLSWRFVEMPFRNKQVFNQKVIFTSAIVMSCSFITAGVVFSVDGRFSSEDNLMVKGYKAENRASQLQSWDWLKARTNDQGYDVTNNQFDHTPWFDLDDPRRRLLLVGNSHSKDIFNVLMSSTTAISRFQIARFGTELADIRQAFYLSPNYQSSDMLMYVSQYKPADLKVFNALIDRAILDGKKIIFVKNIYEFEEFGRRTYADFLFNLLLDHIGEDNITAKDIMKINEKHFEQFTHRDRKQLHKKSDALLAQLQLQHPQLVVLDRMDYVCDKGRSLCYAMNGNYQKFFYDYGHHTLEGAEFFGTRVDTINWLASILE